MPEEKNVDDQPGDEGFVEFPFPTYYTNAINIASNYLDFQFLVQDRLNSQQATIRARIVMTPAHAKLLLAALGGQVQRYEERWGEIRLPTIEEISRLGSSSEPEPQP
jgi:hypothetical protein